MATKQNIVAIVKDKRGRILSIGKNSYVKTHTIMFKLGKEVGEPNKIFLHAEVDAIIGCSNINKAHSIHVYRKLKSGKYGLAKPCKICMKAIQDAGIEVVTWSE